MVKSGLTLVSFWESLKKIIIKSQLSNYSKFTIYQCNFTNICIISIRLIFYFITDFNLVTDRQYKAHFYNWTWVITNGHPHSKNIGDKFSKISFINILNPKNCISPLVKHTGCAINIWSMERVNFCLSNEGGYLIKVVFRT